MPHEPATRALVIFDFDGTLADSAGWFIDQLPDLARAHGFRAPSRAEIEDLRLLPTREIVAKLGVSSFRLSRIAADLKGRATRDADAVRLFPDIAETLSAIHAMGLKISVVSSNSESNVRRGLGEAQVFVAAYECGASLFGKAAKFRRVLKRLNTASNQACAVGDEVRDIEAARQAGVGAVAVAWGYNRVEALTAARPDVVIERPGDLLKWLRA